jgi:hypothetical protein
LTPTSNHAAGFSAVLRVSARVRHGERHPGQAAGYVREKAFVPVANTVRRTLINDGIEDTGCPLKIIKVEYRPSSSAVFMVCTAFWGHW